MNFKIDPANNTSIRQIINPSGERIVDSLNLLLSYDGGAVDDILPSQHLLLDIGELCNDRLVHLF